MTFPFSSPVPYIWHLVRIASFPVSADNCAFKVALQMNVQIY